MAYLLKDSHWAISEGNGRGGAWISIHQKNLKYSLKKNSHRAMRHGPNALGSKRIFIWYAPKVKAQGAQPLGHESSFRKRIEMFVEKDF